MTRSPRQCLPSLIAFLSLAGLLQAQLLPMPTPPNPGNGNSFPPVLGPTGMPAQTGEPDLDRKRDPFWPVGYLPRKPVAIRSTPATGPGTPTPPESEKLSLPDWHAARKLLNIQGVSLIGREKQTNAQKYLAMIGGRLVETGNAVSVTFNSYVYRWKITEIKADGISLVKIDVRPE